MSTILSKDQFLKKVDTLCNSKEYVDVVELARDLGMTTYARRGTNFHATVRYKPESDTFHIEVNPDHPPTRVRFSIAHEIAYYVLHRDQIMKQGAVDRKSFNSLEPK